MTTPLIREALALSIAGGMDPVEMQWFDITQIMTDQTSLKADVLMHARPPFAKCMVVSRGPSRSHASYDIMMMIVGDDPEKGILVTMWKGPTGVMPRRLPSILYTIEDEKIMYGPVEETEPLPESEANLILATLGSWYHSMMATGVGYQPFVQPTFTNQRKIAKGKTPTYSWHTVVIDGKSLKCESQGGTHSSPRLHDRRGHSRRLPDGRIVWVKPCKVGSASLGAVFHDYEVKP